MRLAISRGAAPSVPLSRLATLVRERGLDGVEIGEPDLEDARDGAAAIVAVHVASPASIASARVARMAAARDAPVVAARGAVSAGAIAEVDALYRDVGATLCIAHGTDVEEAARILEAIDRAGASSVFTAWEIDPTREDLREAPAVILATGGTLRYIRVRGGGPELGERDSGIGSLFASVALSGYRGTVAIGPSSVERAPLWERWLARGARNGCGSAHARASSGDVDLDIRPVEPKDRMGAILGAYRALASGRTLRVTFDHDPSCMRYTLEASEPEGSFTFDRIDDGPEVWRVNVRKRAP